MPQRRLSATLELENISFHLSGFDAEGADVEDITLDDLTICGVKTQAKHLPKDLVSALRSYALRFDLEWRNVE